MTTTFYGVLHGIRDGVAYITLADAFSEWEGTCAAAPLILNGVRERRRFRLTICADGVDVVEPVPDVEISEERWRKIEAQCEGVAT